MKIGLMVDAACDLPREYFDEHDIVVVPISVRVHDSSFIDRRDPETTAKFLAQKLGDKSHSAETEPLPSSKVCDLILTRLVGDYDGVICLTIASSRSPIFEEVSIASREVLLRYHAVRKASGRKGPFRVNVIDSKNLFAAQAIGVVEAVRMIDAGEPYRDIRERLEEIAEHTYGYMVPRDLYYIRARATQKGDNSVNWLTATIGTALDVKPILRAYRNETRPVAKMRGFENSARALFDYAVRCVQRGLLTPTMAVSYGGDLAELEKLPGYDRLVAACEENGVEFFQSVMSITGMVNVGEGALIVGFAALPHEATF